MPLRARVVRKEQNRANQHAPAAPTVTKAKRVDRTTRATDGDENKVVTLVRKPKSVRARIQPSRVCRGAGLGLFAMSDLKEGQFLGIYKGKVMSQEEYDAADHTLDTSYTWEVNVKGKRTYIDGRFTAGAKNPLPMVNGAKTKAQLEKVNVEMYQYAGMPRYRTTKPVAKGDELILDYGTEYFETRKGEI